jgi:hypothetical protein
MLNSGEHVERDGRSERDGRGEREKEKTQRWQERFARGRAGLSASVDEALADPALQTAVDDDEDEDEENGARALVESEKERAISTSSMLIRPRLSLQSKQLPAVRPAPQSTGFSIPSTDMPVGPSTGAVITPAKKKRLAGRNTRVELQAVPKQEKPEKKRKTTPLVEKNGRAGQEQPENAANVSELSMQARRVEMSDDDLQRAEPAHIHEKLSGAGVCHQGLGEVTVKNSHVSPSSVVLVSLLNNPGPVVVKYYTLIPGYGFSIHLSAPVESETRFNYVILLGELL